MTLLTSIIFLLFQIIAPARGPSPPSFQSAKEKYAELLRNAHDQWPKVKNDHLKPPKEFDDSYPPRAIATPENPYSMGFIFHFPIHAPFESITKTLCNYQELPRFFQGLKSITPIDTHTTRPILRYVQDIPFPFAPDIIFDLHYLISRGPKLTKLLITLKTPDTILYNEGLIVLEKQSAKLTHYSEFVFYDAKWGIAKSIGEKRLWRKNLREIFIGDYTMKYFLEGAAIEKAKEMAEEKFDALDIKRILSEKTQLIQ